MTEETAGTPKFVYLLNTMEGAGNTENPYEHDYAGHRAKVLDYVASLEREVAALTTQRDRIVEVIHGIENRCMAADGPVTQTSDEITERELCMIYALANGENENWRPNNGK